MDPRVLRTAARLIEKHEGRRHGVYLDTEGHPTVGVGFNLDRPGARGVLASVRASYGAVRAGSQKLTDAQIDALLVRDIADSVVSARAVCPSFDALPEGAQLALIDMAFNLGRAGLARFRAMLAAIASGDFSTAAAEALDSRWAWQVGRRALEDAALLRGVRQEV